MINVWGMTDTGLVRTENQDAYKVKRGDDYVVCVVCDGMGGEAGGALASNIAADVFVQELEHLLNHASTDDDLKYASSLAVQFANTSVILGSQKNPEYSKMGTTLVGAVIHDGRAIISNVGDSRAYFINKNGITRITKDHSVVEDLVDNGNITEEEARSHPNRNLITRAVGLDDDVQCDNYVCQLEKRDYLLFCTDGLVNTVTDDEIFYELYHNEDEDASLERMLEIAMQRGAPDNITAILIKQL